MHFTHLEADLKRHFAIDLAPLTLILGRNRAGKTAVCDALELLCTGSMGSVGSTPAAILLGLPPGKDFVRVEGTLSSGATARIEVRGTTAKGQRPTRPVWPDGVAPEGLGVFVDEKIRSFLWPAPGKRTRDDTRRKALIGLVTPKGFSLSEVGRRVPKAFVKVWEEVLDAARAEVDDADVAADVLLTALAAVRKEASAVKKEAAEQTKVAFAAPAWTGDDEQQLETLREGVRRGAARPGLVREIAEHKAEVARLAAFPRVPEDLYRQLDLIPKIEAGQAVRPVNVDRATCIGCGGDIDRKREAAQQEKLHLALARLAQAAAQQKREQQAETLKSACALLENRLATIPDTKAAQVELDALVDRKAKAEAAVAARTTATDAEERRMAMQAIEAALKGVMVDVLVRAEGAFEKEVSAWLPPPLRFKMQLFDGDKSICKLGLEDGGVERAFPVLSGVERAMLTGALARAVAAKEKAPVRILRLDELAVEPETLEEMLPALAREAENDPVTQTIICAAVSPGAKITAPARWHIVHV